MLFNRQYSLRDQNRWLHWLALQNLLSERSHFQIYDIQPDRLGGRFQKLMYRLLFGAIASLLLGGYLGLLYSPILLPITSQMYISSVPFKADWQARWNASILIQLPRMLKDITTAGCYIGLLALIPNSLIGLFDKIRWMNPLQWKTRYLLWFFLPIVFLVIISPSMVCPAIILSLSLVFSFALVPKYQRTMDEELSISSPWTAVINSSYLLYFIVPALLSLVIFVIIQWHDLVFIHILTDHARSKPPIPWRDKYPWLYMMRDPMAQLSSLGTQLAFSLSLGLVWLLRSRPILAAVSLIQYSVMRFLIGLYGLGPFNYNAFLRSAVDQGILTHDIQGYQFVDPDDLEFYALMKFD